MKIIRLTSAVAGRAAVYLNPEHIISFNDQVGGCSIKTTGAGSGPGVIAVIENAETVLQRITDAAAT